MLLQKKVLAGLAAVLLSLISCAGPPQKTLPIPPVFFNQYFPENKAVLDPGDILYVRFYLHPEMNSRVTVWSDGRISLPFFQGIYVVGQTPDELQKKLVEMYSREFNRPEITVNIEQKSQRFVYVTGEVMNGGMKLISTNQTVGMILAESQVIQANACLNSVILVRRQTAKEYQVYTLNADFMNGSERDVYLAPGDILFVPRNAVTKVGDFVKKYIRDIIPPNMNVGVGLNYNYDRFRSGTVSPSTLNSTTGQ